MGYYRKRRWGKAYEGGRGRKEKERRWDGRILMLMCQVDRNISRLFPPFLPFLYTYVNYRNPQVMTKPSPKKRRGARSSDRINQLRISNHTPFPLHVLHNLRRQRPFIRQAHLGRERAVGHPLGRVPRRCLLHHAVDLFEREALGLRDEEVRVDEAGEAEGAPDEEDLGAQVATVRVDHVGGYDCDDLWRTRKFSVCACAIVGNRREGGKWREGVGG